MARCAAGAALGVFWLGICCGPTVPVEAVHQSWAYRCGSCVARSACGQAERCFCRDMWGRAFEVREQADAVLVTRPGGAWLAVPRSGACGR